jgi:putative SOS response-associated peptidase YedK
VCGRVVQARPLDELAELYAAPVDDVGRAALAPAWNVAPTDPIAVVVAEDVSRRLTAFRWGLLPSPGRVDAGRVDPRRGPIINARAETIARNALFRALVERRRCIVPVDGFYEWQRVADRRQPFFIHRSDGRPLSLAGIWAPWRTASDGRIVGTCAIVTTTPDDVVGRLHDRMPAILDAAASEPWLDRSSDPKVLLASLARPAPRSGAAALDAYPVAPWVNNVRNDGPRLLERAEVQASVFGLT